MVFLLLLKDKDLLKNINSLKTTKEFKEVYESGRVFSNRLLVMYLLKKEGPLRIGISVSKKVGNSVERHRVTRLIRESYLSLKSKIPEGLWIVVAARPLCRTCSEKDVEKAFEDLLKRHGKI